MDVHVTQTSCLLYTPNILLNNNNINNNNNNNNANGNPSPLSIFSSSSTPDYPLLQCLNDEKAFLYIPVIVFLGLLVIVGTLGNTLVLCVYWRKPYKASSHYFILSLAALDLFSCLVGLPTEIADLRFPYMFNMPIACKLLRFTHSSTIIASSSILIQVAFDRYYRICKLGQQFSVRKAKVLCVLSILMGILTSWPSCLLFGRKTLNLHVHASLPGRARYYGNPGHAPSGVRFGGRAPVQHPRLLLASDCSTEDAMRATIYPTVYYLFLFSLFFLTVTFFAVLYIRIGVAIWRRKRKTIGAKVASKVNSHGSDHTSTELSSEVEAAVDNPHPPPTPYLSATLTRGKKKEAEGDIMQQQQQQQQQHQQQQYHQHHQSKRRQIRVGKTTTVLFAVTLAYILSFLPYLVVMILRSTIKDFEGRLSPVGEVAYKFCVKSFFINNAINPLIYSFLNASFRADASKTLRKMWHNCCCRCLCCGKSCCCGEQDDDVLPQQSPIAV